MYHYQAGQVAPLPPPVGPGLGTGLTGSAGLTAPPLNMPAPGAYNVMPQYQMGLNTHTTPTMLTPPTTMLTPPTTMLTPPTTMLTPPATMLTPPTTMLTPPTTPIGANPALPVHISPTARITPVKPVSPVLPATPVIPGLVRPVSPAMLSQGPVMPGAFIPQPSSCISASGLVPMSQQPMLLPAPRTAATMNLNSAPTLLAGSLQQSPAMLGQARQPVPLANGLVRDPRLGGMNYIPQPHLATISTGAQPSAGLPTAPSSWVLVETPPTSSIAVTQNQPVADQMMWNPSATNNPALLPQSQLTQPLSTGSHVLLPQAQPLQPLSTRSQVVLPQLRTVQPELTAKSQVMLPQSVSATQPGPVTQTVLLIPAQSSERGLSTVAVTQASLVDSGSQFVLQPSQVATAAIGTDQGRQIVLQVTQVPATPSVSQPPLNAGATAVQDGHAGVSSSASHPVTSQADTQAVREGHSANTATTHNYRTPVQQSGLPDSDSDTTSSSASSSSSSL